MLNSDTDVKEMARKLLLQVIATGQIDWGTPDNTTQQATDLTGSENELIKYSLFRLEHQIRLSFDPFTNIQMFWLRFC